MPQGASKGERRGGRAKGQPNKRSTNLIEKWEELGFDPIDMAIELLNEQRSKKLKQSSKMRPHDIVNACIKLAEFKYPKRKPNDAPPPDPTAQGDVTKVYKTEWGSRKEASDKDTSDDQDES